MKEKKLWIGLEEEVYKWRRNAKEEGGRPLDKNTRNYGICIEKDIFANCDFFFLQLWSLVPAEQRDAYLSGQKTDVAPVIDLLPLGYSKVLGKGRLPQIPVVVRARYVSRDAEEKIKAAGGVVELVA